MRNGNKVIKMNEYLKRKGKRMIKCHHKESKANEMYVSREAICDVYNILYVYVRVDFEK